MRTQAEKLKGQGYLPAAELVGKTGMSLRALYRLMDSEKVDSVRLGRSRYLNVMSLHWYFSGKDPKGAQLLGLDALARQLSEGK